MDSENTTGSTMDVTITCTVSQLSPNSNYTTSQPSPDNTSLTATTTLTTTSPVNLHPTIGILSIAVVITVVVLIVVIRRGKKGTITVENERYATLCT